VTPLLILGETERKVQELSGKSFQLATTARRNRRGELKARTARQDMLGDRNETGYGGWQDWDRTRRETGLNQDMKGDRIKIGYGGRLDSERIWREVRLRQDM
jgi:hypothetical protein